MSSLLNNHLPRFDTGDAKPSISLAHAISRDFLAEGHDDVITPIEIEELETKAAPTLDSTALEIVAETDALAPEAAPDPIAIAQAELVTRASQLEKSLASFSDTVAQIEIDARAQINNEVQNIVAQLFPAIGKAFLADELSKHIPGLVPPMVSSVEVIASPDMAEQLKGKLVMPDGQDAEIKLTASDTAAHMQVKLSWKSGGFDYNFDDLMAACVAHTHADQTMVEE